MSLDLDHIHAPAGDRDRDFRPSAPDPGSKMSVAKDAVVYAEGDEARDWYQIVSGVVRTCRYLPNGDRQVTGFFREGQVFGVESPVYRASAEAVTDLVAVRRSRRSLETACASAPAGPAHPLTLALHSAEDRVQLLVLKGAPARLAGFLLAAAEEEQPGKRTVHLPMRRMDIADYLAIDVATVSRLFSRFVQAQLLTPLPGHRFEIRQVRRLEALMGGEVRAGSPEAEQSLLDAPRAAAAQGFRRLPSCAGRRGSGPWTGAHA